MQKPFIEALQGIINDFDRCKEIAVPLPWAETQSRHCDLTHPVRSNELLDVYSVRFEAGYLQTHFPEAYVQTMLARMAYDEEWELDFWAHMSSEERRHCLVKAEDFYREYLCLEQQPLQSVDQASWEDTIRWVSEDWIAEGSGEAQGLLLEFSRAEVVRMVCSRGLDEIWLAMQDNALLFAIYSLCD